MIAAARLRRHRQDMQLALAEQISLDEARCRRIQRRIRDIAQRRAERASARLPAVEADEAERPLYWWQRD